MLAVIAVSQTGCFYRVRPAYREVVYDERCWVNDHWVYRFYANGRWVYRAWRNDRWVEESPGEGYYRKYKWEKHDHNDLDDGRRW